MLTWVRKLLRTSSAPDDWQRLWDARVAALESALGPCDGTVYNAPAPMHLDGYADVLRFRQYVDGVAYVTCDLIGNEAQTPTRFGQYELMLCMRRGQRETDWAPSLLSRLARYSQQAAIHPGDTMDISTAQLRDSRISALLFTQPDPPADYLNVLGRDAGILLCIGITADEFQASKQYGSGVLLRALHESGVFPFTDLDRDSVT